MQKWPENSTWTTGDLADAKETTAQTIDRIAKEHGVDPRDPVFRARLMKALLGAGYFKNTTT